MKFTLTILAASAFFAMPASAATLLVNGGFEMGPPLVDGNPVKGEVNKATFTNMPTSGPSWDVWDNLPGWTTTKGAGIEIQTKRTLGSIDPHGGEYYVELDSHPGPLSNSTMKQSVLMKAGTYLLSFWYSPRDSRLASNDIGFSLGSFVSGTAVGPLGDTAVGKWTEITRAFVVEKNHGGIFDLTFWAGGTENTYGGLIDDVSLNYEPPAPVPLPAAGLLLLGGLGGLAAVKRRRKA